MTAPQIRQMGKAVRWTFSARRTRQERQQERKCIKLWDAAITKATQERYFLGLRKLLPELQHVDSVLDLDMVTANWIQKCWEQGDPLHMISDALCGLHHYEPWTKRQLPLSWKMFSTWRKLESPDRAPPLTKPIIYAWAYYAVDHCDFIFAGLLLLGFFALLRTGEILKVTAADILLDASKGIVSLRDTKSGERDNVAEMVSFDDPFTLEVLTALKQLKQQQGLDKVPIWPYSGSAFRDRFKQYAKKFDLLQHKFRPYSLRRGGATHLFQVTGSMEIALVKGRWSHARVARIYISDGLSFLPRMTFTPSARKLLHSWNPSSTR